VGNLKALSTCSTLPAFELLRLVLRTQPRSVRRFDRRFGSRGSRQFWNQTLTPGPTFDKGIVIEFLSRGSVIFTHPLTASRYEQNAATFNQFDHERAADVFPIAELNFIQIGSDWCLFNELL